MAPSGHRRNLHPKSSSVPCRSSGSSTNKIGRTKHCSVRYIRLFKTLAQVQGNMAKTWSVLNELMGKKHNAKSIKQLEINNQITENQQEIADKFNDYFINIGPTLAKKIQASKKLLSEYHIRSYSDSMFLFPTTDMEIINIIHDLKNSSSSDYNGIPVKVIKQCSTELSHKLTYINNQSMSDGIFPDQLKIAKVTPIHKAGDIKCLTNYRPISVLLPYLKYPIGWPDGIRIEYDEQQTRIISRIL